MLVCMCVSMCMHTVLSVMYMHLDALSVAHAGRVRCGLKKTQMNVFVCMCVIPDVMRCEIAGT